MGSLAFDNEKKLFTSAGSDFDKVEFLYKLLVDDESVP